VEPCGTLAAIGCLLDVISLNLVHCILFVR
jgi:hypothetical protein